MAFLKQNLNPQTWFTPAENTTKESYNPGIEGWQLQDWRSNLIDRSFGRSTKDVYQGTASGYLESRLPAEHKNGGYYLTQLIDATSWKGKKVSFKSAIKPIGSSDNTFLFVYVFDPNQVLREVFYERVPAANEWQQIAVTLPVSETAKLLEVGFFIQGGGKFYVDNTQLFAVDDDAPVSLKVSDTPDEERPYFYLTKEGVTHYRETVGAYSSITGEHVQDANFDTLLTSNSPWKIYQQVLDNYHVVKSAIKGPSGTSAIEISRKQGNSIAVIYQKIAAQKFLGKKVKVTGVNRYNGVDNKPAFWLRIEDNTGKVLAFYNMEDEEMKRNANWQARSFTLDVLPSAATLTFGVLHLGSGSLLVDSLNLSIVGDLDENNLELGTEKPTDDPSYPTNLVNPDFEF